MSTTEGALTAHLVMPAGNPGDVFLREAAAAIDHQFGIHHCTFQVEVSEDADCHLEPRPMSFEVVAAALASRGGPGGGVPDREVASPGEGERRRPESLDSRCDGFEL